MIVAANSVLTNKTQFFLPDSIGFDDADVRGSASKPVFDSGLVYSETSVTLTPQTLILVDSVATRLKRIQSSILTAARLHCEQKSKWKCAMLTLTYRPGFDWSPYQITKCIADIRQYLKRKGVEMRYCWVQEFTKRGKPHYHVLLWLPLGLSIPKPDKRGWWPCGMTKIEWARNAIGYIAKYASKASALYQPAKGARMHASGGVTGASLLKLRWWKLPCWARDLCCSSDRCRRRAGGGLLLPCTGEILISPWLVVFKGGEVYIRRIDGT